jgi:hypothetical protein
MQSITNLYSSLYLTAIGMNARHHSEDPFDALDGERPVPTSLFVRFWSKLNLVMSSMGRISLKPKQNVLTNHKLQT